MADFEGVRLHDNKGVDKLVFATGLEVGTFSYIGTGALSAGGNSEARFAGNEQMEVDRDGNGAADILFKVGDLTQAGDLTSSDFVRL